MTSRGAVGLFEDIVIMDEKKIMAVIEAVLFAMGDSVGLSSLSHVLEMPEKEIRGVIARMNDKYKRADRGLSLIHI